MYHLRRALYGDGWEERADGIVVPPGSMYPDRVVFRNVSMGVCWRPGCERTDTHFELRMSSGPEIWCSEHGSPVFNRLDLTAIRGIQNEEPEPRPASQEPPAWYKLLEG